MKLREWIEDSWWSWKNCWYFRFDSYEDRIDILAFWEELNLGYYQMRDEFLMSQPNFDPYNLSGRDLYYSLVLGDDNELKNEVNKVYSNKQISQT